MMSPIAKTPKPPYYVVVFTSTLQSDDPTYQVMAKKMEELAENQPGFLGVESARDDLGITVSYWKDETAILNWKNKAEHLVAQNLGKEKWYKEFKVRVGLIQRDY